MTIEWRAKDLIDRRKFLQIVATSPVILATTHRGSNSQREYVDGPVRLVGADGEMRAVRSCRANELVQSDEPIPDTWSPDVRIAYVGTPPPKRITFIDEDSGVFEYFVEGADGKPMINEARDELVRATRRRIDLRIVLPGEAIVAPWEDLKV